MARIVPDLPLNDDDKRHEGCCLRGTLYVISEDDGRLYVIERR
jgi:hypothetical protein